MEYVTDLVGKDAEDEHGREDVEHHAEIDECGHLVTYRKREDEDTVLDDAVAHDVCEDLAARDDEVQAGEDGRHRRDEEELVEDEVIDASGEEDRTYDYACGDEQGHEVRKIWLGFTGDAVVPDDPLYAVGHRDGLEDYGIHFQGRGDCL